jgi:hypothetical protein
MRRMSLGLFEHATDFTDAGLLPRFLNAVTSVSVIKKTERQSGACSIAGSPKLLVANVLTSRGTRSNKRDKATSAYHLMHPI